MKIMILADGNNIKKIKHYIDSYHCFFEYSGEISLSIYEDTNFEVNKYDRVIVDIYNLDKASKLYTNTLSFNNLYLWFRDVLISAQQPTLLNVMLQRAFETKEWDIVKQINKIKGESKIILRIEVGFITHRMLNTKTCTGSCVEESTEKVFIQIYIKLERTVNHKVAILITAEFRLKACFFLFYHASL